MRGLIYFFFIFSISFSERLSFSHLWETSFVRENALKNLLAKENVSCLVFDFEKKDWLLVCQPEKLLTNSAEVGSLLKPLTLISAWEGGLQENQSFLCSPSSPLSQAEESCWEHRGHGALTAGEALANSCNAYFRGVTLWVQPEIYFKTLKRFEIEPVAVPFTGSIKDHLSSRMALGLDIKIIPQTIFFATASFLFEAPLFKVVKKGPTFVTLISTSTNDRPLSTRQKAMLQKGFGESEVTGNLRNKAHGNFKAYVKTGTASSVEYPGQTCGWVSYFTPKEKVRLGILLYVPRGTGATTAYPLAVELVSILQP